MIASAELSRITASRAWISSARRRSVTSRNTSTTPSSVPSARRIGAALSSMGVSPPSLRTNTVWLASPTTRPSRITLATGSSESRRVSSFKM